jgi:alpha-D-xyloside xylohydrolase
MNTRLSDPGASDWILRRARVANHGEHTIDLDVDALPAIELPGTPGWHTGEPLLDQGVEVSMPNLPTDLPLPGVEARSFRCRVEIIGPTAIRVVIAPSGARVFSEQPSWLGIVTEPTTGSTSGSIVVGDDDVVVQTSECRITIGLAPFRLEFGDPTTPTLRTAERLRQVAGFPMAPPVRFREWGPDTGQQRIVINLELSADEQILGFGEQFSPVVKNGQQLVLRCEDALGTGTGLAYKPAPVWHSTHGYLGFINTGAEVAVDVGHVRPSVLSLDVADEALDLYLFSGGDPAERLAAYTTLTGRGDRPPLWAFGYWMGRCRYHSNHEMLAVADEMRERDVPIDVLHVDPDWLVVDRLNTDFIWNTDRFGELDRFVADLADRSTRLSVWEVPYLDPISPRYAEAEAAGFLARTTTGEVAELRGTPTPDGRHRGLVDVTNPDAIRWWQSLHEPFLDAGVAVFKTDFGEGCPDDVVAVDGTPANHLHNLYPLRYNAAVSDAIRVRTGRAPLVWGRSGWAGSHRYPGQWGGDAESTVAGMQATMRGGLSHALSNPGFWSHDIGGFFGPELTAGLYVRWTQFGALSPLMRAHGLRPREPWAFGDDALKIARDWIRLRYSLLPYLWQVAGDVATSGLPMMRPLMLEFPDDPIAPYIDDQFLLGADLLVAPILDDGMRTVSRRIYLPAGRWFDLATDAEFHGPGFITLDVPIDSMPLFVRDGARLPRVDVDDGVHRTDDLLEQGWTLHLYGDAEHRTSGLEVEGFDGRPVEPVAIVRHGVR